MAVQILDGELLAPGRALVPTGSRSDVASADERPLAGFLTQLIASERRLQPYRQARRLDPASASEIYSAEHRTARRILELDVRT